MKDVTLMYGFMLVDDQNTLGALSYWNNKLKLIETPETPWYLYMQENV